MVPTLGQSVCSCGECCRFLDRDRQSYLFDKISQTYPIADNLGFVLTIAVVLFGAMLLITTLLSSYRYVLKPVLILLLIMGAVTSYFTDTYGTVYDTTMLQNALQTDQAETRIY